MGRTPTRNMNLPTGMRARHRGKVTYYYFDTGAKPRVEIPLGSDYVAAVRKWGELTLGEGNPGALITFRMVAERYTREVLPTKAAATQEINLRELSRLYAFFDDRSEPFESIEPRMIRQYLDWRVAKTVEEKRKKNAERVAAGKPAEKVRGDEGQVPANREKALFSHIWNYARSTGLTSKANPCAGIKGFREDGRDAYIDDAVLAAVRDAAEPALRDALDLAYLSGQRPADVLKLSRGDIKDGALWIEQNKTGKKLRISIEGELAAVLARVGSQKVMGLKLINDDRGQPMSKAMLRGAFDRARDAAALAHPGLAAAIREFQFRDLRAKAATDKEESAGMTAAQDQLGHSTSAMTAHYVRHRRGKLVKPTK